MDVWRQWARKNSDSLVAGGLVALLMMVILSRAGVCEDAYITFRVVDNFVHGYGLRWNVSERVQVYTNPLWMLLHIPFYALWENIFVITLALSIGCTLAAVLLAIYAFRKPWWQTMALLVVPLAVSTSFTDYSTSGLENPLTHLLFAAFGFVLLRVQKHFWFWVCFLCALSLVNRLDTAVFYAPVMGWLLVSRFRPVRWRECVLGSLPVVAWEVFSLFYYGFLFPNTKYAKLNAGIAESAYVQQGVHYLLNLVAMDLPAAAFIYFAVIGLPLCRALYPRAQQPLSPYAMPLAAGIALYMIYIVAVGGNHVSGRFWSLPVFASVWLVYGHADGRHSARFCLALAACLMAARLFYPSIDSLRDWCPPCFEGAIAPKGGIIMLSEHASGKALPAVDRGDAPSIKVMYGIGMMGYRGGPAAHLVDSPALADPLLSRLPSEEPRIRRIGHLRRRVPPGYLYALKTGSTEKMDPSLAQYYEKLRLIISGDLFDSARIEEIFKFNFGEDDYLLRTYLAKP